MLYLYCPHCEDLRDESEFTYAGEAYIVRPKKPESTTDQQWGDYVFFRTNYKGLHYEQWQHTHGCRKICVVARDTYTNQIHKTATLSAMRSNFRKWQKNLIKENIPLALANTTTTATKKKQ